MSEILFSSSHVTVVGQDADSRTVVATFNEMGQSASGKEFWGQDLLQKAGVCAIGFMSARPNWFPPADMESAIAAARSWVRDRRLVTYGFSQGGYGALKYGARLGARLAVAFSPQWSIDPKEVAAFDSRFVRFHDPQLSNGCRIVQDDLCGLSYVVADTAMPEDAGHVSRLLGLQRVCHVPARFCGHNSVHLISESRTGRRLVQLLTQEPAVSGAELRLLVRASRAGSGTYLFERVNQLRTSPRPHRRFLAAALASVPPGPRQIVTQILSCLATGQPTEAAGLLSQISDDQLHALGFPELWPEFQRAGFDEGERRIAPLFKIYFPRHVRLRLHGVISMLRLEQVECAVAELRECACLPGTINDGRLCADLFRQAGAPDLALDRLVALCREEAQPLEPRVQLAYELAQASRQESHRATLRERLDLLDELAPPDAAVRPCIAAWRRELDARQDPSSPPVTMGAAALPGPAQPGAILPLAPSQQGGSVPKPRREVIYQSAHLTVMFHEVGSNTVVATFNEVGLIADGSVYWGHQLLEPSGVTALGFVSARPNWYPPAEMKLAIAIALAKIAGRRVVTYGFSQGGYGALKFGARLGASLAMAFSPQWSIAPDEVGSFDRRFTNFYDPDLGNGRQIVQEDLCPDNCLVVDMLDREDKENTKRLLALRGTRLVVCPFSTHHTIRLVTQSRQGAKLLGLMTSVGEATSVRVRHLLRDARRKSGVYQFEKVSFLQRSAERHTRFLAAAVESLPEGSAQDMARVTSAALAGDLDGATRLLSAVSDMALRQVGPHRYWQDFRRAGFDYGESRIAPIYPASYPESLIIRLHGVNSLLRLNRPKAAIQELQQIALLPGAAEQAHYFIDFYKQSGRPDLAAQHTEAFCKDRSRPKVDRIRTIRAEINATRAGRDRQLLFKQLCILGEILEPSDEEQLLQLADAFLDIAEIGFAAFHAARISRGSPRHRLADMYRLRLLDKTDRAAAQTEVASLMRASSDDFHYWLMLSKIAGNITGLDEALAAAHRAMRTPNVDPVVGGLRMIETLTAAGRVRPAVAELRTILALGPRVAGQAHGLAEWATKLKKPQLAADFAALWLSVYPDETYPNIVHLHYLSMTKPLAVAARAIDAFLHRVEGGLVLTRDQFRLLFNIGSGVDPALGRRCAALALERFPDDKQFTAVTVPDSFEAKFGLGMGDAHRPRGDSWRRNLIARLFGAG